ncbi:kinesin-like protein Klp98A isoform X3 [Agrilus planipennis]|uniref:Kinesin-like protein Klp98A isoform X3 n=1 Tax=Agrilus planipennis TaxID=224129 RepID=A0A7F5RK06_AGRPL|nr:kinesin-like protein Klp98A isoform X3 [Agrilus planipennis]
MFSHYNETEVSDNKLISLIKDRLRFSEGDNSEVFEQLKQLLTQQKFEETEQSKQFTSCLASICASSSHQELDHLSCSPKSQTEGELSSDDDTKHFHDFPHPSASRSMLRDINENNCDNIISITNYILRGAGNQTHYEYEVKINTTDDKWTVYRRYSRFRELYLVMKSKYGQKVSNIPFPPRQLFRNTEAVAKNRKRQLETYLRLLIQSLGEPITREALINISPFFKKGIFENGKYSTS